MNSGPMGIFLMSPTSESSDVKPMCILLMTSIRNSTCHRRVRQDTSSVEILADKAVALFPFVGFLRI